MNTLTSLPHPAPLYDEAMARFALLKERDDDAVNPVCYSQVLVHGQKVDRAIVLLHGYTNCPQQFITLSEQFFERGYNVLIPRQPYAGLKDRLNTEHGRLNAAALARQCDEVIDIAQGLGRQVCVLGLSSGGVAAAWIAQFRSDVALAMLIAPNFGLPVARPLNRIVRYSALRLPNRFFWWDSRLKEKLNDPPHGYPRFSTRALAEIMRLGDSVRAAARTTPPSSARVVVVTSANDAAISHTDIDRLVQNWRARGASITTHHFAAELDIKHDMIDPAQPYQQTEVVYPVLIKLLEDTLP